MGTNTHTHFIRLTSCLSRMFCGHNTHSLNQAHELVVHTRSIWLEKARAWGQAMEEKQLLLYAKVAMVTLLGLQWGKGRKKCVSMSTRVQCASTGVRVHLSFCVCVMCVYVCMCLYTCVRGNMCVRVRARLVSKGVYVCKKRRVHVCMRVCVCVCINVSVRVHARLVSKGVYVYKQGCVCLRT